MNFKIYIVACVVAGGISLARCADPSPATSHAPDTTQPTTNPSPDSASISVPQSPYQDPTEAQAALRQAIDNMHANGTGRTRGALPLQVTRRGLVVVAGKPPEALIEIQGAGLFLVHDGSVISAGVNYGSMRVRIAQISADEIEIEVESQKQKVIVR